jgi:hypothetical protein
LPFSTYHALNPDFEAKPKLPTQLDDLDVAGDVGPIVLPADDPVALLGVVLVGAEAARPEFKLDSNALLAKPGFLIGNAIRVGRLNPLNPQPESRRDAREQEHNAEFILRGILERAMIENLGALFL